MRKLNWLETLFLVFAFLLLLSTAAIVRNRNAAKEEAIPTGRAAKPVPKDEAPERPKADTPPKSDDWGKQEEW